MNIPTSKIVWLHSRADATHKTSKLALHQKVHVTSQFKLDNLATSSQHAPSASIIDLTLVWLSETEVTH